MSPLPNGGLLDRFPVLGHCSFRHHHNREEAPRPVTRCDLLADLRYVVRNLGNQNYVGRCRNSRMESYESRVAAHHLDHHHSIMALRGRVKLVDRFDCRVDCRVETERRDRTAHIVVDRLRDSNDFHPLVNELLRDRERAVSADCNERIDAVFPGILDHILGPVALGVDPLRTDSRVSGSISPSSRRPLKPCLIPSTSQPRSVAARTAARMTALRPGASPPPVSRPMRIPVSLQ